MQSSFLPLSGLPPQTSLTTGLTATKLPSRSTTHLPAASSVPTQPPVPSSEPRHLPTSKIAYTPTPIVSPSPEPPGVNIPGSIEVVNVVMKNMENYLPTDVVEQDDDARYVIIDHLLFGDLQQFYWYE